MRLWHEIRQRRITQIILTYLAGGWMALAVVDQVVDREVLPSVVYEVALVVYLFGIGIAAVLGWYHGEKGHQKASMAELVLLTVIGGVGLGVSGRIVGTAMRAGTAANALESSSMDLRRLAVLYFDDRSADGSLAPVADALTEGLISSLKRVRELDVVSRDGSGQMRTLGVAPDSAAALLQAGTVIQGSVAEAGDEVEVTVRLLDGQSGTEIDRDRYSWPSADLAAAPDRLAQEVSRSLRLVLGEEIRLREGRENAPSTAAWLQTARAEKALKDAHAAIQARDAEAAEAAFDEAERELARAREAHPDWLDALVLSGQLAYDRFPLATSLDEAEETLATAEDYADRALRLEPDDAAALELRGTTRYRRWLLQNDDEEALDRLLEDARTDLEQSLTLDRTRASANSTLSHLYYQVGNWAQTVIAAREAYRQDAYLSVADGVLWRLYAGSYDLGDYEGAGEWCTEGARRFPKNFRFTQCRLFLLTMPQAEPSVQRAWSLYDSLLPLVPEGQAEYMAALGKIVVGGVVGRAGLPDSADHVLVSARVGADVDPTRELLSMEAAMRSVMGDVDGSVEVLERFMAANPERLPRQHWWWDNAEGNPTFERLQGAG